jgi:pilus assembly protein Flp/PilA
MRSLIREFCTDKSAATAIEYAIIAGMISIAIVAGVTSLGTELRDKYFGAIANALT